MEGKREIVVHLCQEGYSMSVVASMVNMSKAWVGKAVNRLRQTGSNKGRAKKGRPRNRRTAATIRKVRGRIDRNPRRSIWLISRNYLSC
jgi:transposase